MRKKERPLVTPGLSYMLRRPARGAACSADEPLVRDSGITRSPRDEVLRRVDRYLKDEAYLSNFGLRLRSLGQDRTLMQIDRCNARFALSFNARHPMESGFLSAELPPEEYETAAGVLSAGLVRKASDVLEALESVRELPLDSPVFPEDPVSASVTVRSVFTRHIRRNGEFQTHPWSADD